MTAKEVRAKAVDRIARARFAAVEAAYPDDHRTPSEHRALADNCRLLAEEAVDALGDLLPTSEEVSTCFPDEPAADDEAMRRYVTDWQEVPR